MVRTPPRLRGQQPCCGAKAIWARNTAVCVLVWALPKPSLPWLESWPACSTGSSNTASRTLTKAPNIMKPSIASNRSDHSPNGHKSLAFNWLFRRLPESAIQGFWKDSWPIAFFGCARGHRVNKETQGLSTWDAYDRVGYSPSNRALRESTGQRQV